MNPIKFTIPIAPVTKKNQQRILLNKKTGKRFIAPSAKFLEYQEQVGWFLGSIKNQMLDKPINIKAVYYRDSNRKVDITNLHSALHDVLVHYGVLADDSSINPCIVVSTDGSRVFVDKTNPRTEVVIEEVK